MNNKIIDFVDENQTRAKIKVIGVGGCGGNAVNTMLKTSLEGEVAMYAVNTDAQALSSLEEGCERIQIGQSLAKGLGVGANYQRAEEAANQDIDRIEEIIEGADMVFIAAGMGGGTGTGAAPVIAAKCRDKKILTVAVVTKPFGWENRDANAAIGITKLSEFVDSIIIVPNDRIKEVYGEDISFDDALLFSDAILSNAVSGIYEIIYEAGRINVDFADVKAVMSETGQAMMGTVSVSGIDRASRAATEVIACPLLEDIKLSNASGILINMTVDTENFSMKELEEAVNIIKKTTSESANVFYGLVDNKEMGEDLRITLVATGLRDNKAQPSHPARPVYTNTKQKSPRIMQSNRSSVKQANLPGVDSEVPAVLRRQQS